MPDLKQIEVDLVNALEEITRLATDDIYHAPKEATRELMLLRLGMIVGTAHRVLGKSIEYLKEVRGGK